MRVAASRKVKTIGCQRKSLDDIEQHGIVGRVILRAFFAVFAIAFFTVIVLNFCIGMEKADDILPVMSMAMLCFFIIFIAFCVLKHFGQFFEKHYKWFLAVGAIVFFALNIAFGFILRYKPFFDLGAIYNGAIGWLEKGSCLEYLSRTSDPNYFYFFPNNLGGMSLLYIAFKIASVIGVNDYYAIAMVENALLAVCTFMTIAGACKCALGKRQSILTMFLTLLFPPMYLIAPVFYTDSLSMLFPVLIVYLYIRWVDANTNKQRIMFCVFLGVAAAIGMMVKFTVLIALIAVIVYHIIFHASQKTDYKTRFKKIGLIVPIAATAAGLAIVSFSFSDAYFYSTQLDKEKADKLETPVLHWIMMSMSNSGRYSSQDYEFTRSFTDKAEQHEAIRQRLVERVESMGIYGMAELFAKKSVIIYGDGSLGQTGFFALEHEEDTALHSIVMRGGTYNQSYKILCDGVFYMMLLLCAVSAATMLFRKNILLQNCDSSQRANALSIIPLIAMFGVLIFFMFWEVAERYITNFVPLIILGAAGQFRLQDETGSI